MKVQNILFWVSVIVSVLFGIITTGFGIYLAVKGQDCLSYNDYACAFSGMFSFVIIPYGLAILLFVGLASLPFKIARLIGAIISLLTGLGNVGFCCITVLWALSLDGAELVNAEVIFFLFPVGMFVSGMALIGVGLLGYQKAK